MLNRKFVVLILLTPFFLFPALTFAQEKITIYLFESKDCPHCKAEKAFLEKLELEMPQIEIKDFEITTNPENVKLLKKIGKELNIDVSRVPITIIGDKYFSGYDNDEITGKLIRDLIKENTDSRKDLIASIITSMPEDNKISQAIPDEINIPFFGKLDIKKFSLPVFTIIIGAIDGFNPCAMWVLIFLITLLLGMRDRKRMWILGTAFIASSGVVYFLFLAAWLNIFLFLGFIFWIRLIIGLVALASGGYYLKKYFTDKADTCDISEGQKQQKIFDKLKNIVQKKQLWLALVGIILLAAAINLVELICSAGLPAIYTQVLSLSNLSPLQYYLYLILYIFIFMLDDMVVFIIAMTTLKTVGLTKKYSRYSALIGGTLMIIVGLLLIFKPAWLMFG